jgi:hypothetical protein
VSTSESEDGIAKYQALDAMTYQTCCQATENAALENPHVTVK